MQFHSHVSRPHMKHFYMPFFFFYWFTHKNYIYIKKVFTNFTIVNTFKKTQEFIHLALQT